MKTKLIYEFGSYRLDAEERVLSRDGEAILMQPKDLETLLVLVERAGHIVDKNELLQKVWPGVFVEEGNLARRIFNLRQLLGEGPDGRQFIETIPKRGYRFVARVGTENVQGEVQSPAPLAIEPAAVKTTSRRPIWRWVLASGLVLAAVLVTFAVWNRTHAPTGKVMLAVLPFENLSGDDNQDYFADGLTEEMIAQLGQLQPTRLGVIARTSIVRYKHTRENVAQIGQELGVGFLLEGSVRRSGDRVRITAQLVRAAEQTHLWAETYERPVNDVLTIQREIAQKITGSLSIKLLPGNAVSASNEHVNLESYDKYLLGLHELGGGSRDNINRAIQYFQESIQLDPKDARLYAALAQAYAAATTYYSSPAEVMPRAKEAALRAVDLDPNYANAHVQLGYARLFYDWDWAGAEKEFRQALELNPSLPDAQLGYADYLATLGRFDEALLRVQQAYLYDPLTVESRHEAVWIYYFSGRMPETISQCQRTIELEPAAGVAYAVLAMAHANLGHRAQTLAAADDAVRVLNSPSGLVATASALAQVGENARARKLLSQALDQAKDRYVCRFLVATAYMELGEKEEAMQSLQEAFLQRST